MSILIVTILLQTSNGTISAFEDKLKFNSIVECTKTKEDFTEQFNTLNEKEILGYSMKCTKV